MKHFKALLLYACCLSLVPLTAFPTQYSKLAVITAAKSIGRWDALKSFIQQAGYYDEWLVCQYLSDEHPAVPAMTNAIVSSGVMTAAELSSVLTASKDTSIPDKVLVGRYARDIKTDSGRTYWHGKRVSWIEDTNTLTVVSTYADGTTFTDPFEVKKPQSASARLALIAKQQKEAEERRLAQLPPGLQEVERKRLENACKTNEVNVIYTP